MSETVREWLENRILVLSKEDNLESINKKVKEKLTADAKEENPEIKDENIYIDEIRFKSDIRAGDEIWTYHNGKENFRNLHGEAGFALVRFQMVIERQMCICS
jgi:hypothetical protein